MANRPHRKKAALGWVLSILFAIAMIMGPGPGIYLVNPDPAAPGPAATVLGMPVLYVWAVGWFFVQLAVVLVAYFAIWSRDDRKREAAVVSAIESPPQSPRPDTGGNDC